MENIFDKSYDEKFRKIETLKWLPWIGKNYSNSECKILLVGESHYGKTDEALNSHNDNNFTREIILDMPINRRYYEKNKLYPITHKSILGNDTFTTEKLWSNIAFYNFVQRTMHGNKNRPTTNDFISGWQPFYSLVNVLKPSVCIFLGVSALSHFQKDINGIFNNSTIKHFDKLNNGISRSLQINKLDSEIKIVSIRHPSAPMFSWNKWHQFLSNEIPNEIDWLKKKVL